MEVISMILGITAVIVAACALVREEELRRLLRDADARLAGLQKEFDELPEEDYFEIVDMESEGEPEEYTEDESGEEPEDYSEEEIEEADEAAEDEEPEESEAESADEPEAFEEESEEAEDTEESEAEPEEAAEEEPEEYAEPEDQPSDTVSGEEIPDTLDEEFEAQVALIQQEFDRQDAETAEEDAEPEIVISLPENEDDELEKAYFRGYASYQTQTADEQGAPEVEAAYREVPEDPANKIYDGVPAGNSEVDYIVNRLRLQLDTESFMGDDEDEPGEIPVNVRVEGGFDDDDSAEEIESAPETEAVPAEEEPAPAGPDESNIIRVTGRDNDWLGASRNHRSEVRNLTIEGAPFVMDSCVYAGFRGHNTAELTFRNITQKVITSLTLDILCDDPDGNSVPAVENYEYKDLTVKPGRRFGSGTVIDLPDWTAGITPVVKYILFSDDTYWESESSDWIHAEV